MHQSTQPNKLVSAHTLQAACSSLFDHDGHQQHHAYLHASSAYELSNGRKTAATTRSVHPPHLIIPSIPLSHERFKASSQNVKTEWLHGWQNCLSGSKRGDPAAWGVRSSTPQYWPSSPCCPATIREHEKLVIKAPIMCRLQKVTACNSQPHLFVLLWQLPHP